MWQDYDYNHYEKNKSKMLSPQKATAKIVEMIHFTFIEAREL